MCEQCRKQSLAEDESRAAPLSGAASELSPRQPNSYGCFVCGLSNPIGLKIVFHQDRERQLVYAELTVPEIYRSYPGVVHGGIVATILDETSGRALIVHTGDINTFFATAKMEVRYRQATPTDTPLIAVGWVERMGESRAWVKGELWLGHGVSVVRRDRPDSVVLAECKSLIVRPQPEFLGRWDEEISHWRVYTDEEIERALRRGRQQT